MGAVQPDRDGVDVEVGGGENATDGRPCALRPWYLRSLATGRKLMLTRLEIDGFKNLLGLKVDFGPFTCIAGPNGSGKSNVFDAIQFLSLLADHEIVRAAQMIRSVEGRGEDPRHLFLDRRHDARRHDEDRRRDDRAGRRAR